MLTSQQHMLKCAEILFKVKYDNIKRHIAKCLIVDYIITVITLYLKTKKISKKDKILKADKKDKIRNKIEL